MPSEPARAPWSRALASNCDLGQPFVLGTGRIRHLFSLAAVKEPRSVFSTLSHSPYRAASSRLKARTFLIALRASRLRSRASLVGETAVAEIAGGLAGRGAAMSTMHPAYIPAANGRRLQRTLLRFDLARHRGDWWAPDLVVVLALQEMCSAYLPYPREGGK